MVLLLMVISIQQQNLVILPQKGQYIIYDLGQERTISKIQMYCQDSAVNYIRDADILVSDDLEELDKSYYNWRWYRKCK